jgi:uncharacterized protein involved in cysteine biosynthesis
VFREPFAWLVMALSVAGALLVLAGLAALGWWLFAPGGWLRPAWLDRHAWGQWLSGGLGLLVFAVAAWFLFPVIVTAVAGMFLESLADRIERRHYPELPPPRDLPLGEQFRIAVRGLLRGIGWNLLALPLYLIPVVNLIAYAYVNARLLSREYFQVVAVRHLPAATAGRLYRQHHWHLIRGGLPLMALFVLPVVQLVAPLLATAWTVHRLWRRPDAILRLAVPQSAGPVTGNRTPWAATDASYHRK